MNLHKTALAVELAFHRLVLAAIVFLIVANIASASPPTTQTNTGWLSAYDEQPTVDTYIYRLAIGDIELGHDVYLATADCGRIGETGVIIIGDNEPLNYQVFDCLGADAGYDWMARQNIIAEVDYWTWQRYGLGRATMTAGE